MNKTNFFITTALAIALMACSEIPKEAYYTRGHPEDLIDNTSEKVSLDIGSSSSIGDLTELLNHDQPTRAEVKCLGSNELCAQAQNVLHQFGVPVKYTSASGSTVTLVYERLQARDCENRYIDNPVNPYNLNYPTLGCSTALNIVQMVSDKRQITQPPLMGSADANKAAQAYGFASQPTLYTAPAANSDFNAIATQQSLQTNGLSGGSR